ncbi:hypothetical protein, partial [Pseudacidovorax intermedius]|uniref:hypothetical protein n=1 Tax=Pseudacidovorax intermedius TaxID=433924 RepID=UPI00187BCF1C
VDVYASALTLTAGNGANGIGASGNALELEVNSLSASTAGTGGVFLAEASAITVAGGSAIGVNRVGAGGGITANGAQTAAQAAGLASGGALVLTTTAGSLTLSAAATAGGNLLLQAGGSTSDLDLRAVVSTTGSTAGSLSLAAGRDLLQAAAVSVAGAGFTVDAVAGRDIVQTATTGTVSTSNGNVVFSAERDLALESIAAGTARVSLTARTGSIADVDAGSATDVVAGSLRLTAGNAIGGNSAAAALETSVDLLSARAGDGGVYLVEGNGLTVGSVSVDVNRVAATGVASTIAGTAQEGLTATGAGGIAL